MKKNHFSKFFKMFFVAAIAFVLVACGNGGTDDTENNDTGGTTDEPVKVVSSFSMITDMVEEIGGEYVDVHNLVPIGTDPHEYEPLPEDIKAATDADILFYNGLNLEGGENGWFFKLLNSSTNRKKMLMK